MSTIGELENPFSVLKSTEFTDEEIYENWVENNIFHLLNPTEFIPKYILGSKGSGKTHNLKFASFPLQKIKSNFDYNKLLEEKYIGLHYETYALKITRFRDKGISHDQWSSLFEYYLDLYLVDNLLNTYNELLVGLNIDKKTISIIIQEISTLFIDKKDIAESSSFLELISKITDIRNAIDSEINNVAYTKKFNVSIVKSLFSPGDLIFGIPEIIANNVEILKSVKIIYIIDEYEKFEDWQKEYINTLVLDKRNPVSFWISMRTWGFTTKKTKTADQIRIGHEFKLLDIDAYNSQKPDFLQNLCTRRLEKYYQNRNLQIKPDELFKTFSEKFEVYNEEELIAYFTERSKKEELKHITNLRNKSTKQHPIPNINEIIKLLIKDEENPLQQKYKFFRFYFLWNKNKNIKEFDLLKVANEVNLEYAIYKAGKKSYFDEIKDKRKKDLIAQLCLENNAINKNIEHSGLLSLIERSHGNPRNILMLLMKCVEYSKSKNENPLTKDGKISIETQYQSLYETAIWFYETIEIKGEDAKKLYDSLYFLSELLKINRYCDKPSETSVYGFNVSQDNLTVDSKNQIDNLEKYSILIKDDNGRKEKNSSIKEVRYNLNKILSPLWGLPIKKRGVLDLNYDLANLIFDYNNKNHFENEFKKIKNKLMAPFTPSKSKEENFDLFTQDIK